MGFSGEFIYSSPYPVYGKIYGVKYIKRYKDEVDAMFLDGCEDNINKTGPGRMLEALRLEYPDRFEFPSETEIIRQRITCLTVMEPLS